MDLGDLIFHTSSMGMTKVSEKGSLIATKSMMKALETYPLTGFYFRKHGRNYLLET